MTALMIGAAADHQALFAQGRGDPSARCSAIMGVVRQGGKNAVHADTEIMVRAHSRVHDLVDTEAPAPPAAVARLPAISGRVATGLPTAG